MVRNLWSPSFSALDVGLGLVSLSWSKEVYHGFSLAKWADFLYFISGKDNRVLIILSVRVESFQSSTNN